MEACVKRPIKPEQEAPALVRSKTHSDDDEDDARSVFSELTDPMSDQDHAAAVTTAKPKHGASSSSRPTTTRAASPRRPHKIPVEQQQPQSPDRRSAYHQKSLSSRNIPSPSKMTATVRNHQQNNHLSMSDHALHSPNRNRPTFQPSQQTIADDPYGNLTAEPYKKYSSRSLLQMCGSCAPRRFSMGNSSRGSSGCGGGGGRRGGGGDYSESHNDDDDDSLGDEIPQFEMIMAIVSSWEGIKTIDGYEEKLSEQILLRMMELDSHVRKDLGLLSIRSPEFWTVSEKIISVIDGLVSFLGPDLEDFYDKISDVGDKYRSDGFKEYLLAPALVDALKYVVPEHEFPPETQRDWTTVMNFLVSKMEA